MNRTAKRNSVDQLAPVQAGQRRNYSWTDRLVLYLRIVAAFSMLKGLFHWALVCGIGADPYEGFEWQTVQWQSATVFFAVIDLVAAVGLWLFAPWGVVVWLTASVSMIAVVMFFPQVYGGQFVIVLAEMALIGGYLFLAIQSAREEPQ